MQPVLETLSPDEINTFTNTVSTVFEGDGSGLAPMLDGINRLTRYASDRQQIIGRLMDNLATVADTLGGKSPQVIQILKYLNRPLDAALSVLDEFRKSKLYGPEFTGTVVHLLDNIGLGRDTNVDQLLSKAFTSAGAAANALRALPTVLDGLSATPRQADGSPTGCTNGQADLPLPVKVLLNGQKVILCKPL
ncbi:MCE family protein [Nocardia nepalensis]|uniref:MCE family protein n=1 Tax=Nocardia nepalensis TaxID=3375448 RepID=UPI003B674866